LRGERLPSDHVSGQLGPWSQETAASASTLPSVGERRSTQKTEHRPRRPGFPALRHQPYHSEGRKARLACGGLAFAVALIMALVGLLTNARRAMPQDELGVEVVEFFDEPHPHRVASELTRTALSTEVMIGEQLAPRTSRDGHAPPVQQPDRGDMVWTCRRSRDGSRTPPAQQLDGGNMVLSLQRIRGTAHRPPPQGARMHIPDPRGSRPSAGAPGRFRRACYCMAASTTQRRGCERDPTGSPTGRGAMTFLQTDDINEEIDAAYRTKYRRYASIVDSIVTPEARSTTIKLVPRSTGA
jgi:hypothetical protein